MIEKLNIVFDVDDTLWPLNEMACRLCGIDYNKIEDFKLYKNTKLTEEEQGALWDLYQDPTLWQYMKYVKGAMDIHTLISDDVDVWLVSNCINERVSNYKRSVLSRDLLIPDNRIILNVTDKAGGKGKVLPANTFIFVDDSPYNLVESTAEYDLIPAKRWNRDYKKANAYRFNDFEQLIAFIRVLIKDKAGEHMRG